MLFVFSLTHRAMFSLPATNYLPIISSSKYAWPSGTYHSSIAINSHDHSDESDPYCLYVRPPVQSHDSQSLHSYSYWFAYHCQIERASKENATTVCRA